MWEEHLRKYLGEATQEVEPDETHWRKVVALFQTAFYNVTVVEEDM